MALSNSGLSGNVRSRRQLSRRRARRAESVPAPLDAIEGAVVAFQRFELVRVPAQERLYLFLVPVFTFLVGLAVHPSDDAADTRNAGEEGGQNGPVCV